MTTPAYLAEGLSGTGDVGQQFEIPNREPGQHAPEVTAESLARLQLRQMLQEALRESRIIFDHSHPVDEYQSTPGLPASVAQSIALPGFTYAMNLMRSYDMPERIESILWTLPVGCSAAIAKLGDRYINLLNSAEVPSTPNGGNSITRYNTVTGPGAGAVLATVTIPVGTPTGVYDIGAFLSFNGTGATNGVDSNNVAINVNGVQVATVNTNVTAVNGNSFPLTQYVSETLKAGDIVSLTAIGAGGVAVIYQVNLSVTPVIGGDSGIVLALPISGEMNGLGIILNQDDDRILYLAGNLTAGPCHFELMGWADEIFGNA